MFDYLFSIFDIPLVCILIMLSVFAVLFIKNIYNIFLTLFTCLFFTIFIASTILTQQIYLGEFLVIGIFFIFSVIFFVFNLKNEHIDSEVERDKIEKIKLIPTIFLFVCAFLIIGLNFYKINNLKTKFVNTETITKEEILLTNSNIHPNYENYKENISLLNQNKIFQKLTHIVMFYICMVVVLYFFSKGDKNEG